MYSLMKAAAQLIDMFYIFLGRMINATEVCNDWPFVDKNGYLPILLSRLSEPVFFSNEGQHPLVEKLLQIQKEQGKEKLSLTMRHLDLISRKVNAQWPNESSHEITTVSLITAKKTTYFL